MKWQIHHSSSKLPLAVKNRELPKLSLQKSELEGFKLQLLRMPHWHFILFLCVFFFFPKIIFCLFSWKPNVIWEPNSLELLLMLLMVLFEMTREDRSHCPIHLKKKKNNHQSLRIFTIVLQDLCFAKCLTSKANIIWIWIE